MVSTVVKEVGDIYDRRKVSIEFAEQGRTKQSFKDECDINRIVKQAERTGIVTHLNPKALQYLDVSAIQDFQTMQNTVIAATNDFMALPATLRAQFGHDAMQFYSAIAENPQLLHDLGLVAPEPTPINEVKYPAPAPEAVPTPE